MTDDDHFRQSLSAWAESSGCRLCVLFGSRTGASVSVKADVDIAIGFSPGSIPAPERRLDIIGELQDICGASRADVVFLDARTDPVLRFEIFRSGLTIFEDEPGLFIQEKVRALMLYEDALPFRRLLRMRLRDEASEAIRVT